MDLWRSGLCLIAGISLGESLSDFLQIIINLILTREDVNTSADVMFLWHFLSREQACYLYLQGPKVENFDIIRQRRNIEAISHNIVLGGVRGNTVSTISWNIQLRKVLTFIWMSGRVANAFIAHVCIPGLLTRLDLLDITCSPQGLHFLLDYKALAVPICVLIQINKPVPFLPTYSMQNWI